MNKRVTPPTRFTSPTWGSSPPCKQALKVLRIKAWILPNKSDLEKVLKPYAEYNILWFPMPVNL